MCHAVLTSHQVLYEIHPDDYGRLCPRADTPSVGGSNKDLAVIVKDWMGLDEAPGPDKKLGGRWSSTPSSGACLLLCGTGTFRVQHRPRRVSASRVSAEKIVDNELLIVE